MMTEKVNSIIEILKNRYPDALCALHYGKDYELIGTYTDKNGIAAKFREREAEENGG